jgi:hypothetical protein
MFRRNPIELTVRPKQVIPFERRPNAENLRANFLARFNNHFLSKPDDELFEQIYREAWWREQEHTDAGHKGADGQADGYRTRRIRLATR